ncbi:hypothetical protein SASPL_115257 [Salvia splendens]|uniref:Uncharacterized protein n=1 Tax=Salvia splendens TaxID=180675 RepID=A0A8X8Y679_SALSN|nr:hypothetical protein SASPL_115257 [Salvia splendens]
MSWGQKILWEGVVEKQMYGENFPCEPWNVFSDIESSYHSKIEEKAAIKYTIYAFTTLLRPFSNSKRVSRRAGNGTWRGQAGPRRSKTPKPAASSANRGCSRISTLVRRTSGTGRCTSIASAMNMLKVSGRSNAADLVVCKITKTVKKVPYAQPGVVSTEQLIDDGLVASIKRAAEVDLRSGEGDDLKSQKCHGKEFI